MTEWTHLCECGNASDGPDTCAFCGDTMRQPVRNTVIDFGDETVRVAAHSPGNVMLDDGESHRVVDLADAFQDGIADGFRTPSEQ